MTAIDTNIIVRLIARDDDEQLERARRLVTSTVCFVSDTVLLETAWVLQSAYGATRQQIYSELLALLGLPNVRIGDAAKISLALQWYVDGLDFAAALHLASSQHAESFLTFDTRFIRGAAGWGAYPVEAPPND